MPVGAPTFYPAGPIAIRDGAAERLKTIPGLTEVYYGRTMPGQDSQLPYAVVWNAGEQTEPWGDANAGAPSFDHKLTLIVDVLVKAPSSSAPQSVEQIEAALDVDLVAFAETVRATLLTDSTWIELVEGVERCNTSYAYPKDSESIMAQARIDFEVSYRSEWPPAGGDDLHEIAVTAGAGPDAFFHQSFPLGYRS